ncbi:hypothetical protein F2Q69_00062841 [Brassica cretica]|uniref:Uncharacterized protein n=1 Tax=Brassica cretica TaxID=69181 RepID=A0A8S9RKT1_BRACR|nr:hypothetical protein F2Q69_00062841 [Brassica cretica]
MLWCWYLEDVFLLHTPDEPDWVRPNHVIENEKNKALQLTPKQECNLINGQIQASEGFDVDWTKARCLYNYHPVEFDDDDFVEEPETNLDLLNRGSARNQLDPVENLTKDFQARIHYSYCSMSQFIMCRPKHHKADSLGVAENDPKKPSLE